MLAPLLLLLAAPLPRTPGDDEVHWSFRPIEDPTPPPVQSLGWPRQPLDHFVLAQLEAHGLDPAPPADRPTLLRRLHLDLVGLPPTPAELDAFLGDGAPGAYERAVDRLLASPHYAERWTRHWLDLARYADSDGYEKDNVRPNAWRWRDWVLDAIDRDLPLDQFVVQQLAGDLLPEATPTTHLATGFHRNTLTNTEGGADQEEFRVEAVADRVDTTGAALLGLTVGCARCHDHKYDDLSQEEYFGLFAFFDSDDEATIDVPATARESAAHQAALAEHRSMEAELEAILESVPVDTAAELAHLRAAVVQVPPDPWSILEVRSALSDAGASLEPLPDGSLRAGGPVPAEDVYRLVLATELPRVTALRLEVFPAGDPPRVGRTSHGNFVLSELRLVAASAEGEAGRPVPLKGAWADYEQNGWPIRGAADGDPKTGWALQPHYGVRHEALFRLDTPTTGDEQLLRVELGQHYGSQHTIAHLRLSATSEDPAALQLPSPVREALAASAPTAEQQALLEEHVLAHHPKSAAAWHALADHRAARPTAPIGRAAVLRRRSQPRETRLHHRGSFLDPGQVVGAGTPGALPPLKSRGEVPDRLDLARWVTSPNQPLFARVMANRLWTRLFGAGLVRTPDDFGVRGEQPTHPSLLDHLARRLMGHGWSRKAFLREVVTSAAYRQSSAWRPELAERDPENRLLARQGRWQVEAEVVRDLFLASAGLLDPSLGGPSVRPPLPADVASLGYADSVKWSVSKGGDRYRRGLYVFLQRTVPYPMLVTFDGADPSTCTVARERSASPLQVLTSWNDPAFVECARALADLVLAAPNDGERLDLLLRRTVGRAPTDQEAAVLATFLQAQRDRYAADPQAAEALAGGAERAAWTATARLATSLEAFLTRE